MVVPSSPLLSPVAAPHAAPAQAVARARDAAADVLDVDATAWLLVAAGPSVRTWQGPVGLAAGYGRDLPPWSPTPSGRLRGLLEEGLNAPTDPERRLPTDLAVLATLARGAAPDRPVAALTVDPEGDLASVAAVCRASAAATGAAIVAAGDLSAGLTPASPRALVDGAKEWDDDVATCVRSGDLGRLSLSGPAEAARVHARGWAPLVVAATVAAAPAPGARYAVLRGVGALTVGWT